MRDRAFIPTMSSKKGMKNRVYPSGLRDSAEVLF